MDQSKRLELLSGIVVLGGGLITFSVFGWELVLREPTAEQVIRALFAMLIPVIFMNYLAFESEDDGRGRRRPSAKAISRSHFLIAVGIVLTGAFIYGFDTAMPIRFSDTVFPFLIISIMLCTTFINLIRFRSIELAGFTTGVSLSLVGFAVFF